MLPLVLLAAAVSSPLPSGDRVAAQDACFTISMTRDGATSEIGRVRQTVQRGQRGGKPVVFVLVHQHGANFDMRDTFVLDGKTMRPIHFENTRNGRAHVVLDYADDRVSGTKVGKDGATTAIDVPLAAPVWEGNLFGVMFAGLPLKAGGSYRVPSYQYDSGPGEFTVRVKGSETVTTPDGPVDAWVLDAGIDEKTRVEYLVAKKSPRELGYRGPGFVQALGGDCSAIAPLDTPVTTPAPAATSQ
jgi:hypothetical protein